jgi:glycogen phosphorylase
VSFLRFSQLPESICLIATEIIGSELSPRTWYPIPSMASYDVLSQLRPTDALRETVLRHLRYTLVRPTHNVTPSELLVPLSLAVRDFIVDRMIDTEKRYTNAQTKRLYYLSMEFLMGRSLGDNLVNLRMMELAREALASLGINLEDVLESELDAGLGNGGLGRLAACFLESLATLGMPGFGYGIDYEYGLFRQEIVNGYQREKPDRWKSNGTPFQIERPEEKIFIPLYGRVEDVTDGDEAARPQWTDCKIVVGVPNDMPVVGYRGETVNFLRLFTARSSDDFDIEIFNRGDYIRAVEQKIGSENISRVLYPSDSAMAGKELRLLQEYFLVACAIRDIVRRYQLEYQSFDTFAQKIAIQLNDTHPALTVAELMRVFMDEQGMEWNDAWDLTRSTCAYTNHTLLPEALERWPLSLLGRVLPRHMQIIYGINHSFLKRLSSLNITDTAKLGRMSAIEEGVEKQVRMAHLAMIGSHAVNGVSRLHSDLITTALVPDLAELWPEKFCSVTNGVAPRRWLLKANPPLARTFNAILGEEWVTDLGRLHDLAKLASNADVQRQLRDVKQENKLKLARVIEQHAGVTVDPQSMFDVQIKRIHEYKRQLLNVLRIMYDYLRLVDDRVTPTTPRTYIFAGKAAPGYWAAKQMIKLIHNVAATVNNDRRAKDWMKVAFLPDYRVSLAEVIIPAADLSEQISTAGTEASGTGNMKLTMNGALTVATYDGANIEILEEVGEENIYIFGLRAEEIRLMQQNGTYQAREYYERDPRVRRVVDALSQNRFSEHEPGLFRWIYDELLNRGDRYFHLADLPSYISVNEQIDSDWQDQPTWMRKSILNIARSGKFSSDRAIREYAERIWRIQRVEPEHETLPLPLEPTRALSSPIAAVNVELPGD